jgi:hypothetical protein
MQHRISYRALAVLLLCALGSSHAQFQSDAGLNSGPSGYSINPSESKPAEPESGGMKNGSYVNTYFDISYPLLSDWTEDIKGPVPSLNGYYVLTAMKPKGPLNGTVLITAQDSFFAPYPLTSAMDWVKRVEQRVISVHDTIDSAPREVQLSGHQFTRLDYTGAGLHHNLFATEIRCHIVVFEITTRFSGILEKLSQQMNNLTYTGLSNSQEGESSPLCIKGYATETNITHRVDPVQTGPKSTAVPVRVVIDAQGKIKHIHIINALPDQARSIQNALIQWTFKPYIQNGHAIEVETGILFEFPPRRRT